MAATMRTCGALCLLATSVSAVVKQDTAKWVDRMPDMSPVKKRLGLAPHSHFILTSAFALSNGLHCCT